MPDQNYQKLMQLLGGKVYRKIENPPFGDLSVERVGPDQISLCHHVEQNGDLMKVPEVVFLLRDETATPVYYRNDYMGVELATGEGHLEDVPVEEWQQKSREMLCRNHWLHAFGWPERKFSPEHLASFVSVWFSELESAGYFQQAERIAEVEQSQESQEHDHERER